ncbi:RNA polymerase sigma factor [Sphingomonas sp.]|uniref:RNA polymerase sigma factor n=1 Tax=Sphingomonas sp. TaxID=28214 RepID=UPI000DB38E8C|nr:RNA polymerase sigma factor [Sphingomonas sp.]PZU09749.1 MAG: RNA polymerase subunit sigma-70 [Sphingomonas sp.]
MTKPETTLEALYGVHRQELLRFLVARTGDPADAEDILQELWIKAMQPGSAPIAHGRAYLYRMAQNLIVDRLRETQRRMRRDRAWSDQSVGFVAAGQEPADEAMGAEDIMLEREEAARLASALGTLPDGARRAFELHRIQGLSHGEVAARLGISKSGVEKHMAVAMKYLRRAMLD